MTKKDKFELEACLADLEDVETRLNNLYHSMNFGEDILPDTPEEKIFWGVDTCIRLVRVALDVFPDV